MKSLNFSEFVITKDTCLTRNKVTLVTYFLVVLYMYFEPQVLINSGIIQFLWTRISPKTQYLQYTCTCTLYKQNRSKISYHPLKMVKNL